MKKMLYLECKYKNDGKREYRINQRKNFESELSLDDDEIERAKKFAYDMTFEGKGEHRKIRTGSETNREPYEIFLNTFNGKLGEIAVKKYMGKLKVFLPEVDFETYALGEWDSSDFVFKNFNISVKTVKHFSNLLLLESGDWTVEGLYKPNIEKNGGDYHFHILVRLRESKKIFYAFKEKYNNGDTFSIEEVDMLIKDYNVDADIPGFATKKMLIEAIKNKHLINRDDFIGANTRIEADNYYIQAGALYDTKQLAEHLKKN